VLANVSYLLQLLHVLVAVAVLVVGHHVQAPCVGELAQALNCLLALRPWNLRLDNWLLWLVREEGLLAIVRGNGSSSSGGILSSQRSWDNFGSCLCSWAGKGGPRAACCAEERGHCEAEV
jgi:hypothetical protein